MGQPQGRSRSYVGTICEPDTIQEFACDAGEVCCLGDDETAAAALPIPL